MAIARVNEYNPELSIETNFNAMINWVNWCLREMEIGRVPTNTENIGNLNGVTENLLGNVSKQYAEQFRLAVQEFAATLPEEKAMEIVTVFPEWQIGVLYKTIGTRLQYNGKLYKVKQAHTSQADWMPDITPALYELIDASHSGTIDDPIPFETGMAIEQGKYYTQYEVEYLCIRDSINPLYNDLSSLIGIYVEVVQ